MMLLTFVGTSPDIYSECEYRQALRRGSPHVGMRGGLQQEASAGVLGEAHALAGFMLNQEMKRIFFPVLIPGASLRKRKARRFAELCASEHRCFQSLLICVTFAF